MGWALCDEKNLFLKILGLTLSHGFISWKILILIFGGRQRRQSFPKREYAGVRDRSIGPGSTKKIDFNS